MKEEKRKISKRIQKIIDENNLLWKGSNKKERRLLVLRDVLKLIKLETVEVLANNGYVEIKNMEDFDYNPVEQCDLLSKTVNCNVCGTGALMLSKIRLNNKIKLDVETDHNETYNSLEDLFSEQELRLIESIFERSNFIMLTHCNYRTKLSKLKDYLDDEGDFDFDKLTNRYYDADDNRRLREICNNIIKADGDVFKGLITNVIK